MVTINENETFGQFCTRNMDRNLKCKPSCILKDHQTVCSQLYEALVLLKDDKFPVEKMFEKIDAFISKIEEEYK